MMWIDFICIAEEQGIETDSVLDCIEKIRDRYDICYTDSDGNKQVIEVEE